MFTINDEAMDRLAQISDNLNKSTTEMNEKLSSVEELLVKNQIGVSVWTDSYFTVNTNGRHSSYKIGFCRIKDTWRIVCQRFDDKEGHLFGKLIPLMFAQRIVRMEAISLINELIQKLTEKAESFLNDVEEKKTTLTNMGTSLN